MRQLGVSIVVVAAWLMSTANFLLAQSGGGANSSGGFFNSSAESVKNTWHKIVQTGNTSSGLAGNPQDATSLSSKGKASPELFIQMAMFSEQSGQPDQAEENYAKALRLSPKHVGALLSYAGFKDRQRSPREALDLYQKAIKYHPKEAAVYNDLGLFYARQRKYQDAIAAYEKAIELQPSRPRYRNNIAIVLVELGDYEKALQHLVVTSRESDAYYNMGYLLSKKGEMTTARRYFAKATEIEPTRADAKMWLEHIDQAALAASQEAQPSSRRAVASPSQAPGRPDAGNALPPPRTARRSIDREAPNTTSPRSMPGSNAGPTLPPAPDPPPSEQRIPTPGLRRLPPPSSEVGAEIPVVAPARPRGLRDRNEDLAPRDANRPQPGVLRNADPAELRQPPPPLPPEPPEPPELRRAKPTRLPPVGNILEPPLPPSTMSGRRMVSR
jgi:Tfp pilus assembly protein PilF